MGAKFYRGADKPKKIRKRLYQTRSWARTLKWVACILYFPDKFRSRPPHLGSRTSFQRFMGVLHWPAPAPRPQEIRSTDSCAFQTRLPRQEPL